MSQDKYLAASRGLRVSTLLLATTVATVLQSLPQALGIDQYRNLRKAVDGLQKADAEMAELEDELSAKLAKIENDKTFGVSVDQIRDREGMETPIPTTTGDGESAKKLSGRGGQKPADIGKPAEPVSSTVGAAAEIKADDAKTEGAAPDQASLNV